MAAKRARKGTRGAASARDWNGLERFEAIAPVMGRIMQLQEADAAMAYAPAEALTIAKTFQREIQEAVRAAATDSGASEDQIRTWVDSFASLGKPGLMNEIPLEAADCAANLNGTWELTSRFSGGAESSTRSQMYCDMDPDRLRGTSLITMWTEVNSFEKSGPGTIFLIGLAELQFKQNGPYEVIGTSRGTTFGNFPGYETGVTTTDNYRLVRRGQNETMLGNPIRTESGGSDSFARDLVEVSGDPGTIKFKMWGVKATENHPRTIDTVDTYTLMSNRRPLVGGWEPIGDYFKRMTEQAGKAGKKGSKFQPPGALGTRESLRRYCQDVPIPRNARRA
jgi:hypothetical protein